MEDKRKSLVLLIVGIFVILIVVVGATYAYFQSVNGNTTIANINTTSGTVDNLSFLTDEGITLNISEENLQQDGDDVSETSVAKATLIANNTTNEAEATYNVYILIENNEIEYSSYEKEGEIKKFITKEAKEKENLEEYKGIPELVIKVEKNENEYEIKKRLNKTTEGYDITEAEGLYAIAEDEVIRVVGSDTRSTTDEWKITIIFKNLDYNQQLNAGKKFEGKIILTKEKLLNEISTINDLVKLSEEVNDGDSKEGKYYILTRDLNFENIGDYQEGSEALMSELTTGSGFTPIGIDKPFSGTFDGENHKIGNLYLKDKTTQNAYYALFGWVQKGEIKNLTLSGEVTTDIATPLGGIVNRLENSIIDNCVNEVNITNNFGSYAVGGIVSWIYGNESSESKIINCVNKGTINGGAVVGGILGSYQGGNLIIENIFNEGEVINNVGTTIGGIIGAMDGDVVNLEMNNCHNNNEIKGSTAKNIGGLIGNTIVGNININNSSNEGKITISKDNAVSNILAGGIIGQNNGILNINNAKNNGEINDERESLQTSYVGGIVGYIYNSSKSIITNSSNHNKIINSFRGGGIVGLVNNSSIIIDKSFNEGNIETEFSGNVDLGGIVGLCDYTCKLRILNSYNLGNISGANAITGIVGCLAHSSEAYIVNSYNVGNIKANNNATGIAVVWNNEPLNLLKIYLNNVYNLGTVNATNKYGIGFVLGGNASNKVTYNAYYKSGLDASNINLNATPITEANNLLVDILNKNIVNETTIKENDISKELKEIDPLLDGYTLSKWKLGSNGYPTLDY